MFYIFYLVLAFQNFILCSRAHHRSTVFRAVVSRLLVICLGSPGPVHTAQDIEITNGQGTLCRSCSISDMTRPSLANADTRLNKQLHEWRHNGGPRPMSDILPSCTLHAAPSKDVQEYHAPSPEKEYRG